MIRSHVFLTSHEAYDVTQTDVIRDGDVLLVPSENRAAVVASAWPVLIGATNAEAGAFHPAAESFRDLEGGKYLNAAIVGCVLLTVASMTAAGLGTSEHLLNIAREHGWAGEIPAQERWLAERDDSCGAG